MNKKSFFSGLASGAILMALCIGVLGAVPRVVGLAAMVPQALGISRGNAPAAATEQEYENISIEDKIASLASLLNKYYVEEIDYDKMLNGIYAGMVDSLGDPYTTYMDKTQLEGFLEDTDGSFTGIGIEVMADSPNKGILVVTPIADTPAAKAGVLPGDRIIKVNGFSVDGQNLSKAVSMMRGPENTDVTITVYRESSGENLDFTVNRQPIDVSSVKHEMLQNQIGYIRITQFNKNTYEQFMAAYTDLNGQGQKGLIIDLRNNPGGLFDVVGKITDTLVPEGVMVYTIDKNGNRKDSTSDAACIQIPLTLLVNENSASASEILSGAVQDMNVGKLVGTQTFGKGLVQGLYTLKDGSGVKITIQKYYTPKGVCIQGEGITPDYVIELPEEVQNVLNIPREQDTQLEKAIEVIQGEMK